MKPELRARILAYNREKAASQETAEDLKKLLGMIPPGILKQIARDEERAAILRDVVRKCRENVYLGVRILRPDVRVRGMTLTTYEALGVYLLDAYTQYDVVNGHSEAFMLTPDFAETMEEFFRDELIAKHAFSEGESLEIMEELARRCGATGKAE